jgi:hypothetical protein
MSKENRDRVNGALFYEGSVYLGFKKNWEGKNEIFNTSYTTQAKKS